jgi:uncharacterized protein YrzB (UPF0473 family)
MEIKPRDLYTFDDEGNQTDKPLHDINDDKAWREIINEMYNTVDKKKKP